MNMADWLKTLRGGGSFICELALKMFQINGFKTQSMQGDAVINEILLYGAENEEQMNQIGLDNLFCINYIILHASRSVDVCVPSLVSDDLANYLIAVHQKNKVKIRIIIHNSDNFKNLQTFARNGIELKMINPVVRLEHEFLLIDATEQFKNAVAVMGSLDYDTTRLNCNRDSTVLTSETTVINALKREFDRVWYSVSDIAYGNNDKFK